jgi:hypothetical protein
MAIDNKNNYTVSFKGKQVDLFDYSGKFIRRFNTRANVVNAVVNGAGKDSTVAISMQDGKFEIYKSNGTVIRRS